MRREEGALRHEWPSPLAIRRATRALSPSALSLLPSSSLTPQTCDASTSVMSTLQEAYAFDASPRMLDTRFGRADWVSLPTFFGSFLPPLPPSVNLDSLMRRFGRQKFSANRIVTKGGLLWGYAKKKPADLKDETGGRSDAFKHLYTCANKLAKGLPHLEQKFRLHHNEENAWYEDDRRDDFLPDAYLCRLGHDGRSPTWPAIALSGAYVLVDSGDQAAVLVRLSYSIGC